MGNKKKSSSAKLLEILRKPPSKTTEAKGDASDRPDAAEDGGERKAARGAFGLGGPAAADKRRGGAGNQKARPRAFFLFSGNKGVGVGVDIAADKILMVKALRKDKGFELLDMHSVPLAPSLDRNSPDFAPLLQAALTGFLGAETGFELWNAILATGSDLQLLAVPKVPKRQLDNAVYWSAKKEMGFEEKDTLFDYEQRGETVDKGASKYSVFAQVSPKKETLDRKEIFDTAGFSPKGLTHPSFAVQNIFRRSAAPLPAGGAAVLFVGWTWSRLEIHRENNLVFSRVIKASMAGMEQNIYETLEGQKTHASPEKPPSPEPQPESPLQAEAAPAGDAGPSLAVSLGDDTAEARVDAPQAPEPEAPTILTIPEDETVLRLEPEDETVLNPAPENETVLNLEPEDETVLRLEPEDETVLTLEPEEKTEAKPETPTTAPDKTPPTETTENEADPGPDQRVEQAAPEAPGGTADEHAQLPEGEEGAKILLQCLIPEDRNTEEKCALYGFSPDNVFDMIGPAVSRLTRQVEMTLKHYQQTLGNDPVSKLYVTGRFAGSGRFRDFLGAQIGLPVEPLDPLGNNGFRFAGTKAASLPLAVRAEYNDALGLALSGADITPNLLHTYKAKRRAEREAGVNRWMLIGCAGILAGLAAVNMFQETQVRGKENELAQLKAGLGRYNPLVTLEFLEKYTKKAGASQKALRMFAERNYGLAAVGEIIAATPKQVRLLDVHVKLGRPDKKSTKKKKRRTKRRENSVGTVVVEGIVTGDSDVFESELAGFLVTLKSSGLFAESDVVKNELDALENGEQVLRFTVSLTMAELNGGKGS